MVSHNTEDLWLQPIMIDVKYTEDQWVQPIMIDVK